MKIQVVSYDYDLSKNERIRLTAKILNETSADFILFSGRTILNANDIFKLQDLITNNKVCGILEVKKLSKNAWVSNCPFLISRGVITNMNTNQLFSTSDEIKDNYLLAERFVNEVKQKRIFKVTGKTIMLILCGENGIIGNMQSDGNRSYIRIDDPQLKSDFSNLLAKTDIFINPKHTPLTGCWDKMYKRCEFLTQNKKYYFTTNNNSEEWPSMNAESLQFAYYNKKRLEPSEIIGDQMKYTSRVYDIV